METPAMETAPAMETTSMETTTDTACSMNGEGPSYWWRTSGSDLSRMLHEANYPEEAQRQFLDYYRDTLCPLLGNKPESNSLPAAVGWDGNPFEYSFEFKGSTKNPGVRFVLDLSELRPPNKDHPLSIANSEKVLETLAKQSPMFDDKWVRYAFRLSSSFFFPKYWSVCFFPFSLRLLWYAPSWWRGNNDSRSHPVASCSRPVVRLFQRLPK